VWLLRHAKTRSNPPKGGGDHDRRLSPRGRRDAGALGERLAEHRPLGFERGDLPQLVLCSTARRTVETVELAFAPLRDPPPVRYTRALYTADPDDVLGELHSLDDDTTSVMVVGHNPTAAELAVALVARGDPARREVESGLPTCALAVYRFGAAAWSDVGFGSGDLAGFFTPPF